MYLARRRWVFLVLLTVLLLPLARPAAVAAQQGPPDLQKYVRPNERLVTVASPLRYLGVTYQAYYMTTGAFDRSDLSLFYFADAEYFKAQAITGLLLTANGQLVQDEDTEREVFALFRAAAYLYERTSSVEPLGYVDDDFVNSFTAITSNPLFIEQQIKALFSTPVEQNKEALGSMLTSQTLPPGNLADFAEHVKGASRTASTVADAVDQALTAAKYANSRAVRNTAKDIKAIFKSWEPVTEQGKAYIRLNGTEMDFANALDVLDLGIQLLWIADYQQDRIRWLDEFEAMAEAQASFDQVQHDAAALARTEANENWVHRADIILQFVKDKSVDLGVRIVEDALAKKWVEWAWKQYGKRSAGHLMAGAASAANLGFTIGNLLFGLDDLFDNFKTGERADGLRQRFYQGRLQILTEALREKNRGELYSGELASSFRAAYMLESLAAAQMYRSYADGVEATIRQNLLAILNPIAWFRGKEWRQAIEELRALGKQVEVQAEENVGHPSFVDDAVGLVNDRLGMASEQRDAVAASAFIYDIVLPGETARLDFVVRNSGQVLWSAAEYRFVATAEAPVEVPRVLTLPNDILPGAVISWTVSLPVSGAAGIRRVSYQMQAADVQFGSVVTGYVFVLPPQLKDAEGRIRRQIEEWQQKGEQAVETLIQQILAEIQKELERQTKNLLDQLFSQCSGSILIGLMAVVIGRRVRRDRA